MEIKNYLSFLKINKLILRKLNFLSFKIYSSKPFKILTVLSLRYSDIYSVASNSDYKFLKNNFNLKNKKVQIRSNWVDSRGSTGSMREKNRILSENMALKS